MPAERWRASGAGRSRAVGFERLLWLVANATDPSAAFESQARQTLLSLDRTLREAGSTRAQLLSVPVFLASLADKPCFDRVWDAWIGADPQCWPQRVCLQAGLANGLMIEIQAVAAR